MTTNRSTFGGFMLCLSSTRITAVFFILVLLICPAWGQFSQRSSISGIVTDTTNAVIPGAKVSLKDLDRSRDSSTTTDDAGRYSFSNLTIGHYVVQIEQTGFQATTSQPID